MRVIAANSKRFKNIYNKAFMKICNKETQSRRKKSQSNLRLLKLQICHISKEK